MYRINNYHDVEDLKHKLCSDPTVLRNASMLAHALGFGWCGGTKESGIGEDFAVTKHGEKYVAQARYNRDDPFAEGYWADKRLRMTFSNFRIVFDLDTMRFGKPKITKEKPELIGSYTAQNQSDHDDTISKTFSYSLSTTTTHTTNFTLSAGIKVGAKGKAGVPFVAEGEVSTELSIGASYSWQNSESKSDTKTETNQYTGKIPPHSKRQINCVVLSTEGEVDYEVDAVVEFDMEFYGFMRFSGNARSDHPKDRPFETFVFGGKDRSACPTIADLYDHRHIGNYSKWDWESAQQEMGNLGEIVEFFRRGISTPQTGKFKQFKGVKMEVQACASEPLGKVTRMLQQVRPGESLPADRVDSRVGRLISVE